MKAMTLSACSTEQNSIAKNTAVHRVAFSAKKSSCADKPARTSRLRVTRLYARTKNKEEQMIAIVIALIVIACVIAYIVGRHDEQRFIMKLLENIQIKMEEIENAEEDCD